MKAVSNLRYISLLWKLAKEKISCCQNLTTYYTTKYFLEKIVAIKINKINVKMNNPVYQDLSTLRIKKIVMYEYWHNYVKPKYAKDTKLWCMDMGNFIIHMKSKDIYADLAGDVKKRLETSKYEIFKTKNSKKDHYQ